MSSAVKKLELRESIFYIRKLKYEDSVWYDLTTARFLSISDVFYKNVEEARELLSIKTTVDWGKQAKQELTMAEEEVTLGDLIVLKKIHARGKLGQLEELAFKIIKKFKLAPRWQFSIEILIITDTLILPVENTVYAHLNIPNKYELSYIDLPSLHLNHKKRMAQDPIKMHPYLTITVSEKMPVSELTKRVANIVNIERLLDQLPKFSKSRVKDEVMYWGHLVWATRKFVDPNMSLPNIEKYFDKLKPDEDVPEHRKLNLYYKRFLDARHKLGF